MYSTYNIMHSFSSKFICTHHIDQYSHNLQNFLRHKADENKKIRTLNRDWHDFALRFRLQRVSTHTDIRSIDEGRGTVLLLIRHLVPIFLWPAFNWTEEAL